jgi:hypothetical protein
MDKIGTTEEAETARLAIIQKAVLDASVAIMLQTNFETFADPRNKEAIHKATHEYVNKKLLEAGFPADWPRQKANISTQESLNV